MSYKVILGGRVKKRLKTLDGRLIPRILEKIHLLAENPRPRETLKLVEDGTEGWRVRVGKYRILYTINDHAKEVIVYDIDLRDRVYRKRR